jgi:hypothetical protein
LWIALHRDPPSAQRMGARRHGQYGTLNLGAVLSYR